MNLLDPGRVAAIRKLLETRKVSQRKIALVVGVGRSTVRAMAANLHPRERLSRCPSCGAMVDGECRLCRLKQRLAKRPILRSDKPEDGDLSLNLVNGEREAYRAIHRRKMAKGEACGS